MKVLIIVADLFLGEPMGALLLSAVLKREGHETRLLALRRHALESELERFQPDIAAYSAMTAEAKLFSRADRVVQAWARRSRKRMLRIMGGPHPTFFPEVVNEMALDAICIGEGDNAIIEMVSRFNRDEPLSGIPNVVAKGEDPDQIKNKELICDLDSLPFADKTVYYEAAPAYKAIAMRCVMAGRGCPYACTYCHNHGFRKIFRGCGPILRRRSVDNLIQEIDHIIDHFQPVKLIKFCDDTFAYRVDKWLLEFVDRYKKEIGLPFYCLMRSNTLSEEMARLLSEAGCVSIGMSVESGDEVIRNEILKRKLSDQVVISSFSYANKYGIKTYGNTLLAIPGTSYEDDFKSFLFTKKLGLTVPTFAIFNPYHKTELTEYAMKIGALPRDYDGGNQVGALSPLTNYTLDEKKKQLALAYLGTLFCALPDGFIPVLKLLLKAPGLKMYKYIGTSYMVLKTGMFIFPGIYSMNPLRLWELLLASLHFFIPGKRLTKLHETREIDKPDGPGSLDEGASK